MKCLKCNKEYSDNVYNIHVNRCKKEEKKEYIKPEIEEVVDIFEDEKVNKDKKKGSKKGAK